MTDIPDEAVEAADRAYWDAYDCESDDPAGNEAACIRAALEAAAPALLAAERERIAAELERKAVRYSRGGREDQAYWFQMTAQLVRGES